MQNYRFNCENQELVRFNRFSGCLIKCQKHSSLIVSTKKKEKEKNLFQTMKAPAHVWWWIGKVVSYQAVQVFKFDSVNDFEVQWFSTHQRSLCSNGSLSLCLFGWVSFVFLCVFVTCLWLLFISNHVIHVDALSVSCVCEVVKD